MTSRLMPAGALFQTRKGAPVDVPEPLAPLADTHGHLTSFKDLDASVAIARAALAGVSLLAVPVDPSDDVPDVPAFLSWFEGVRASASRLLDEAAAKGVVPPAWDASWGNMARLDNSVYLLAGVHPYGAARLVGDSQVRRRLEELLDVERCVGVGEFGLDYGPWNDVAPEVQEQAFRLQLRIAHERGLPVELHLRDAQGDEGARAHVDALRILEHEGVPEAGCDLHCFTCSPEVMEPFVELGCRIAFGGAATFARSDDIRAAAARCPEDLLLSETDSPYMAPVPLRGQECEPAMVAFSAACVASVREQAGVATREATYRTLWNNARRFFGLA